MPFHKVENPPEGYYTFVIYKVEDGPSSDFGESIKWYLQIKNGKGYLEDSQGVPFEVNILTSNKVSPKSRAGKIIKAVFGCELDMVELDTLYETLEGGEFGAMLMMNESGYPTLSQDVTATSPKPFQVAAK